MKFYKYSTGGFVMRHKTIDKSRKIDSLILLAIGTGNNTEKGNRLLRFVDINRELYLRVNIKPHRWICLKVKRQVSRKKYWIGII